MSRKKLIDRSEPLASYEPVIFQKLLTAETLYLGCVCMFIEIAEIYNNRTDNDNLDKSLIECFNHHLIQLILKHPNLNKILWGIDAKRHAILHQSGQPLSEILPDFLNQLMAFCTEQPIAKGTPIELVCLQNAWHVQSVLFLDITFKLSDGKIDLDRETKLADGEYCFILPNTQDSTLENASIHALPLTKAKHKQVARGAKNVWAAGEVTFRSGQVEGWNLQSGSYNKQEGWKNIKHLPFPSNLCSTMSWLKVPDMKTSLSDGVLIARQRENLRRCSQDSLRRTASTGSLTQSAAEDPQVRDLVSKQNLSPRFT